MIDRPPPRDFGKRRAAGPAFPQAPPKRSNHVALLVMGTLAVGGGAYALMPGETCVPPAPAAPGMAAPAVPQSSACTSRGSSGGGSGGYSRSSGSRFFGGDSSGTSAASSQSSGGVTRGGFGSFARAFGFGGG
jgi:hypothetical protein